MTLKPDENRKQQESMRALRQELAIRAKELADQKWVFEQFLKSPSWRLTYPIRWIANHLRNLRSTIDGRQSSNRPNEPALPAIDATETAETGIDSGATLKLALTSQYQIWLGSFLSSGSKLEIAHSENPKVSILLVLHNRAELTFACLRSIAECRTEELEVIIVDNASSDDTSKLLDRLCGVHVIRNSRNLNFLLAANQAALVAHGEHILLLNNDAQLLPGTLRNALLTLTSAPNIGAVGARIVLLDGSLQEAGSIVWSDGSCLGYGRGDDPLAPEYMFRRDVDYCSGAFLLTPRRVWKELGGFDESFQPAYYEEADYCMRLWKRGLRVVYEPGAVIVHYEFASSVSTASAIQLQIEHQRVFAERHRDALKDQGSSGVADELAARSRNANDRILFLDDRVPHVWLGSGFPRARSLILSLLKYGCFVTIFPLSEGNESWEAVYSDLPREVEVMTGLGSALFEMFMRSRKDYYSSIVVSRPHNMKILQAMLHLHPDWFEQVHIIYDAESLFTHRDTLLKKIAGESWSDQKIQEALNEEIQLASSADCVISVSEKEGSAFSENGIRNVHIVGHSVEISLHPASFEQRSGLLFVGAIHSEESPNADSMVWFLTEILPRVQAQLGNNVQLTIAGVNNSARVRKLAGPSVHFTGHLQDLTEIYANARLFVAPTRYAAGLPHKIHEAAARGIPVVATPLLASQLNWTEGELAIGADAIDFAERCIELYTDPAKWLRLRDAALKRVRAECSNEIFDRAVEEILSEARRN